MIELEVTHSGGCERFETGEETITIGRSHDCTLVIPSTTLSRKHGQIVSRNGRLLYRRRVRGGRKHQ